MARGCAGEHVSFRSCWTRFDSWTGYLRKYLASVTDSTVVFEAARRGSTPWQGTDNMSSECAGFARDFAMVEDQVRFLAGTLVFSWSLPKEVSREQTQ